MISFNLYLWKTNSAHQDPLQPPSRCCDLKKTVFQGAYRFAQHLLGNAVARTISQSARQHILAIVHTSRQLFAAVFPTPRVNRAPSIHSTDGVLPSLQAIPDPTYPGSTEAYERMNVIRSYFQNSLILQSLVENYVPTPFEASQIELQQTYGRQLVNVEKCLGWGGCKSALQLSNGKALLVPNGVPNHEMWAYVVRDEILFTELLTKIGLLSPYSTSIMVFPTPDSDACFPGILSNSFATLAEEGTFVLDSKTASKLPVQFFRTYEESLDMERWRPLMKLIVQDSAKVVFYQIPLAPDCLNYALVKDASDEYRLRYFGFDFSTKGDHWNSIQIPENFSRLRGPEQFVMENIRLVLAGAAEALWRSHFEYGSLDECRIVMRRISETFIEEAFQAALAMEGPVSSTVQSAHPQASM